MRTIRLTDLHQRARQRPAGYVDDVLARAVEVTSTHYTITEEAWAELAAKYRKPATCRRCGGPHPTAVCPIPEAFDPEQERRRLQHGGCCGSPGPRVGHVWN